MMACIFVCNFDRFLTNEKTATVISLLLASLILICDCVAQVLSYSFALNISIHFYIHL